MAQIEGPSINFLHLLLALAAAAAIAVGSLALLPEEIIDYGIMAGILVWTSYVLVSQWNAPPLRRVFQVAIAIIFLCFMAFFLWPFHQPM